MSDPILDQQFEDAGDMFEEGKAEYEEAYGIGVWPQAVLTEVATRAPTNFGLYKLTLKFNLKGDSMPLTSSIDLPRTLVANGHEIQPWQQEKEDDKLAVVNRLLAGLGRTQVLKQPIDDDDHYNKLANVFMALVGNVCPIKVSADGKNDFTPDENGKGFNKKTGQKGTWTFKANGYTLVDGIRPRKAK